MTDEKSLQLAKKYIKKMPMPNGIERKFKENGLKRNGENDSGGYENSRIISENTGNYAENAGC